MDSSILVARSCGCGSGCSTATTTRGAYNDEHRSIVWPLYRWQSEQILSNPVQQAPFLWYKFLSAPRESSCICCVISQTTTYSPRSQPTATMTHPLGFAEIAVRRVFPSSIIMTQLADAGGPCTQSLNSKIRLNWISLV